MRTEPQTLTTPRTANTAVVAVLKPLPAPKPAAPIPADLADLARLSIKEVASLVSRSESSLRDMIRDGRFPKPDHRDGLRCVRWSAGLVKRWLAATTSTPA